MNNNDCTKIAVFEDTVKEIALNPPLEKQAETDDSVHLLKSRVEELERELDRKNNELALLLSQLDLVEQVQQEKLNLENNLNLTNKEKKTIYKLRELNEEDKARASSKCNEDISKALNLCSEQCERLRNVNKSLTDETKRLALDVEINHDVILKKAMQNRKDKETIATLQNQLASLESQLSSKLEELQNDRNHFEQVKNQFFSSISDENKQLRKSLDLRNKEMNKVKWLAKNILLERTDTERFFLEAFNHARKMKEKNRSHESNQSKDVSFSYLTWKEKEKIIQNILDKLFSQEKLKAAAERAGGEMLPLADAEKIGGNELAAIEYNSSASGQLLSITNEPTNYE